MLRLLAVLTGVMSCTIILAELVGLGYLWSKGYLTNNNLYEIRLILTGEARDEDPGKSDENKTIGSSQQELQSARVMRVLDLESRGKELELLKTMTENRANQLISDQKSFDEMKENFRTELANLKERTAGEAVEQARAVLLASPTDAAVQRLMDLPPEEAIHIVRGMPEKSIAKILQGFDVPGKTEAGGAPDERRVRGQKIFEALSRGEPARTSIQDTLSKVPEGAAEPPPSGG
jgi:hypothetical protein